MRTPIIAVTLLSAACNVTDTGNPVDTGGEPSGNAGSCEEVETVITPDELTPLGFSAADVLGVAGGRHTETLAWLQGGLATSSGGEPTQVEVNVDFDGSARFIESSPRQSLGGSGSAADFAICNDRVELDATLTVSTADGALDETVSAVLRAETARLATASFSIPSDELSGDLKVNVNAPDGFEPEGLPTLQFDIDLTDVGFTARIEDVRYGCIYTDDGDAIETELLVQLVAARGPANQSSQAQVGYFVAVGEQQGQGAPNILVREAYQATAEFQGNRTSVMLNDELTMTIPIRSGQRGDDFTIFVGLVLDEEEVEYNRRQMQ